MAQTIVTQAIGLLETQLTSINRALESLRMIEDPGAVTTNRAPKRTLTKRQTIPPVVAAAAPTISAPAVREKRVLSPAARAAISAALKKRWRKAKRAGTTLQAGGY